MIDTFLEVAYGQTKEAEAKERVVEAMKKLPIEELHKIASGESKLAYFDHDGSFLQKFKGTPLFDQAVQLEQADLQIKMEQAQERQQQDQGWRQRDAQRDELCVEKKMLELELAKQQDAAGEGPEEPEEEAGDPDAPVEAKEAGAKKSVAKKVVERGKELITGSKVRKLKKDIKKGTRRFPMVGGGTRPSPAAKGKATKARKAIGKERAKVYGTQAAAGSAALGTALAAGKAISKKNGKKKEAAVPLSAILGGGIGGAHGYEEGVGLNRPTEGALRGAAGGGIGAPVGSTLGAMGGGLAGGLGGAALGSGAAALTGQPQLAPIGAMAGLLGGASAGGIYGGIKGGKKGYDVAMGGMRRKGKKDPLTSEEKEEIAESKEKKKESSAEYEERVKEAFLGAMGRMGILGGRRAAGKATAGAVGSAAKAAPAQGMGLAKGFQSGGQAIPGVPTDLLARTGHLGRGARATQGAAKAVSPDELAAAGKAMRGGTLRGAIGSAGAKLKGLFGGGGALQPKTALASIQDPALLKTAMLLKAAYLSDHCDDWLSKFKGTPLFEQAVQIEEDLLGIEQAEIAEREEERGEREARYAKRDEIRVQKRQLSLELVKQEEGMVDDGGEEELAEEPPEMEGEPEVAEEPAAEEEGEQEPPEAGAPSVDLKVNGGAKTAEARLLSMAQTKLASGVGYDDLSAMEKEAIWGAMKAGLKGMKEFGGRAVQTMKGAKSGGREAMQAAAGNIGRSGVHRAAEFAKANPGAAAGLAGAGLGTAALGGAALS
jgi:hypothetical protein